MNDLVRNAVSAGSPRQAAQLARARNRAQADVVHHGLAAWVDMECDEMDSHALAEVITTATEEEFRTYDYGLVLAGDSEVKRELLARKTELHSQLNNRRIYRRFG